MRRRARATLRLYTLVSSMMIFVSGRQTNICTATLRIHLKLNYALGDVDSYMNAVKHTISIIIRQEKCVLVMT